MIKLNLSHAVWRMSSYSGQNGACVEAAALGGSATWRVSVHSGVNGNCVEVARDLPGIVAVRDSKDRSGPALAFTPAQWQAFTARIKSDQV